MNVVLRVLSAINSVLARIFMFTSAMIVGISFVIVFVGVATRAITGQGYSIVQELPPLMVPWMIFPLLGALLRTDTHITVDFLPSIIRPPSRRILRIVIAFICMIAGAIFCRAGIEAVELFRMTGQVTEMELEFPIWWVYLSFPVGYGVLVSFAAEMAIKALLDIESEGATAHEAEL